MKEAEEAERAADAALRAVAPAHPQRRPRGVPPGRRGRRGRCCAPSARCPAYDFEVRDHLQIGEALGAIDMERGAKVSGARFYFLTGPGALLEFALAQLAISRAVAAGFTPVVAPALVKPEAMEGTGFLGEHAEEVYRIERDDLYLVGTSEVALAGMHARRDARPVGRPAPLRRLVVLLPPRGRLLRQGHPRHHPGALVRQGRDVQLLRARGGRGRAPAAAAVGGGVPHRLELPYRVVDIAAGDLGLQRRPQVRHRGVVPLPGHLPRADRRPRTAPPSRPAGWTSAPGTPTASRSRWRPSTARCARSPAPSPACSRCTSRPTARCTCRRRCARGSAGNEVLTPGMALTAVAGPPHDRQPSRARPAFVPEPGARPSSSSATSPRAAWRPRLVASDLDGTLLTSAGEVSPRTRAAIDACRAAGIPVVGVTGRGPRLLDSVRAALAAPGSRCWRRAATWSTWSATRCCAPSGCRGRRPRP